MLFTVSDHFWPQHAVALYPNWQLRWKKVRSLGFSSFEALKGCPVAVESVFLTNGPLLQDGATGTEEDVKTKLMFWEYKDAWLMVI